MSKAHSAVDQVSIALQVVDREVQSRVCHYGLKEHKTLQFYYESSSLISHLIDAKQSKTMSTMQAFKMKNYKNFM